MASQHDEIDIEFMGEVTGLDHDKIRILLKNWDIEKIAAAMAELERFGRDDLNFLKSNERKGNLAAQNAYCIMVTDINRLHGAMDQRVEDLKKVRRQIVRRINPLFTHGPQVQEYIESFPVYDWGIDPDIPDAILEIQKWFDVARDAFHMGKYMEKLGDEDKQKVSELLKEKGRRMYQSGSPLQLPDCLHLTAERREMKFVGENVMNIKSNGLDQKILRLMGLRADGRELNHRGWTMDTIIKAQRESRNQDHDISSTTNSGGDGNVAAVTADPAPSNSDVMDFEYSEKADEAMNHPISGLSQSDIDMSESDDSEAWQAQWSGGSFIILNVAPARVRSAARRIAPVAPISTVTANAPLAAAGAVTTLAQHAPFTNRPTPGVIPNTPGILPGWTRTMGDAAKAKRHELKVYASTGTNPRASLFNRIGAYTPLPQVNYSWPASVHCASTRGNPPDGIHPLFWNKTANDANSVVFNHVKKHNPGAQKDIAKEARNNGTMRDIMMIMIAIERGWILHDFGDTPTIQFDDSQYNVRNAWYNS